MEDILRSVLLIAKRLLVEEGYLQPTCLCMMDKIIKILPLNFKDDRKKFAYLYSIGKACKLVGMFGTVIVSDAAARFIATEDVEYTRKNWETERPLAYPESMRQEALILTGIDFLGDKSFLLSQYYKKEDGKIIFGDINLYNDTEWESAIVNTVPT